MFVVLDTNHFTELALGSRLERRLRAFAHDATLLTRNISDFDGLASLRVENWLD